MCGLDIGKDGMRDLASALKSHSEAAASLTYVDLNRNWIDDVNGAALLQGLSSCRATLKSLHLMKNELKNSSAHALASIYSPAALQGIESVALTTLDLSYNEIGDEGVEAVAEAIVANPKCELAYLFLGVNKISDRGAIALAGALKKHSTNSLLSLNLSFCDIGAKGGRALLESLNTNTSLQCLYVNDQTVGLPSPIEEAITKRVKESRGKPKDDLNELFV